MISHRLLAVPVWEMRTLASAEHLGGGKAASGHRPADQDSASLPQAPHSIRCADPLWHLCD